MNILGLCFFSFLCVRNTALFVVFQCMCRKKALGSLETIKRIKLVFLALDMLCYPPLTLFSKWNLVTTSDDKKKYSSIEGLYIEYCYFAGGITIWALL